MFKIIISLAATVLLLITACSPTKKSGMQGQNNEKYNSVKPGATWLDTDGKPIQAHGFSVFYKDGIYYWYGENFDLYVDDKTGKGYIWAERPHYEMICSTLADDFTSVTEEYSRHFSARLPPDTREAPAHFMRNGKHYLFTSGTSGYYPNPSLVSTFDDYHGSYIDLGNPHPADTSNTSYCSQISDVIRIPGKKDLYVALADRWMPKTCGTGMYKGLEATMRKIFKDHKPQERNFEEVTMRDVTKAKRNSSDATREATYVWLPITWENGVPEIYWSSEWKLEDFK